MTPLFCKTRRLDLKTRLQQKVVDKDKRVKNLGAHTCANTCRAVLRATVVGDWLEIVQGKNNKKELIMGEVGEVIQRQSSHERNLWKTRCDPCGQRCDQLC